MLANDKTTGVTVQTLHHEKFDHGAILQQTPHPGLSIPSNARYDDLLDIVKPESAKLLLDVVRRRLFENNAPLKEQASHEASIRMAPKIRPDHRRVDWQNWSAQDFCRRLAILGRLWTMFTPSEPDPRSGKAKPIRILLGERCKVFQGSEHPSGYTVLHEIPVGVPYAVANNEDGSSIGYPEHFLVNMSGGTTLLIPEIQVEGSVPKAAVSGASFHRILDSKKLDKHTSFLSFRGWLE